MRTLIAIAICALSIALSMSNAYAAPTAQVNTNRWVVGDPTPKGWVAAKIKALGAAPSTYSIIYIPDPEEPGKCAGMAVFRMYHLLDIEPTEITVPMNMQARVDKYPIESPEGLELVGAPIPALGPNWIQTHIAHFPSSAQLLRIMSGNVLRVRVSDPAGEYGGDIYKFRLAGSKRAMIQASELCRSLNKGKAAPYTQPDATFFNAKHKTDESYF